MLRKRFVILSHSSYMPHRVNSKHGTSNANKQTEPNALKAKSHLCPLAGARLLFNEPGAKQTQMKRSPHSNDVWWRRRLRVLESINELHRCKIGLRPPPAPSSSRLTTTHPTTQRALEQQQPRRSPASGGNILASHTFCTPFGLCANTHAEGCI